MMRPYKITESSWLDKRVVWLAKGSKFQMVLVTELYCTIKPLGTATPKYDHYFLVQNVFQKLFNGRLFRNYKSTPQIS